MAEKLMFPLARWRAVELAYKMGLVASGSWKGKLVRLVGETICFVIGTFVGEQDWASLWVEDKSSTIGRGAGS